MRRLPGAHPANIKNRSSKQLNWLCGPKFKPIFRSLSNAALAELNCAEARRERDRRAKKADKKDA